MGSRRGERLYTNLGFHLGIVHDSYDGAAKSVSAIVRHMQADSGLLIMHSDPVGFELTILYLADTGLEVIQGHVADLLFEVGEVHGEGDC